MSKKFMPQMNTTELIEECNDTLEAAKPQAILNFLRGEEVSDNLVDQWLSLREWDKTITEDDIDLFFENLKYDFLVALHDIKNGLSLPFKLDIWEGHE